MWSMLISTITEPTWCCSFMEAVESECWMLCISCSLGFVVLSLFAGSENKTRRRVNVSSPWCFFKCFFWMMIRLWHGMPPLVLWWSKAQEEVGLNGTHMCAAEKDVQGHLQPNPSLRAEQQFVLTDGDGVERRWCFLRRTSRVTKDTSPSHHLDLLTDVRLHCTEEINWPRSVSEWGGRSHHPGKVTWIRGHTCLPFKGDDPSHP